MSIQELIDRQKLGRKVQGIAAALLPYETPAKSRSLFSRTHRCHSASRIMNAVNMDTGYVNYLTLTERLEVLRWTREALPDGAPFVAGAYIENQNGDLVQLYRKEMDTIIDFGGIPIVFQTARLRGSSAKQKAEIYQRISHGYAAVLAFDWVRCLQPTGRSGMKIPSGA